MKEKSNYTLLANMKYLLNELGRFSLSGILISFVGIFAKILVSVTAIFVPKIVLDAIQNSVSVSKFFGIVVIITLLIALTSFLDLFSHNTMECCTNAFVLTYMNRKWIEKAADMDYDAFTSEAGKQKAEKARNSLQGSTRWGVGSYFPRFIAFATNIMGFAAYSIILATLHPMVMPILVLCYLVSLLFTLYTEKKKHLLKDDIAKTNRRLNYMAYRTKNLNIGKDIRLYSMVGWLREMANNAKHDKRKWDQKLADRQFIVMLINGLITFLRDGAAYTYLIYLTQNSRITIGEFILYFAAISGLGEWLSLITSNIGEFVEANNYVIDFREFMDIPDRMNKEANAVPPSVEEAVDIQLENISFSYHEGGENVLEGINLQIKAGEKLAIVGENGVGKTTLVKLISGLIRGKEGRILVNGVDIDQYARDDYYGIISAVFQDSDVLPISIADNIALNVDEKKDYQRIRECIALAGLEDKINSLPQGVETNLVKQISEDGTELSGGEKQKLLLARALYKKASMIILDEPTAALDPISENQIYLQYNSLIQGKTAIFISHRLSSTRFCDRIILLSGAAIAEIGTHEELMALNKKYAALYEIQSQYYKQEAEKESAYA